ncbi:von Willebrand factor type A domain protein [Pseudobythopirellula maris]|uniref:von Willebrand factor type A domain protein n=1 Tax=Pseudobythopirellula maris TaxID=2527991 RepID=A0A5C5ZJM8_9BACT|nr:VIT domain-containing protein [Pseudobythopirellula maris]TWT87400.1 von Willebrand factor type A domain protein [Pseudobythopirellula maris]
MSPTRPTPPAAKRLVGALGAALLAAAAAQAPAQGLLVHPDHPWPLPRPIPTPTPSEGSYKIGSVEVDATIKDRVATVQVAQTFENTSGRQVEASFVFPLPYDGAIDRLTFLVDGKEHEAELLSADEARKLYESIVRQNKDPALLEWVGTGLFRTSVFPIPAGETRTVTLRYTQLCRESHGLTDFVFPLSTAKYTSGVLDKIKVRVAIEQATPITNLYSPSHAVKVERPAPNRAVVKFDAEDELPTADFRLLCDVGSGQVGASLMSYRPDPDEPGYFLMLARPELPKPDAAQPAKTVLLVVDRSGSMSGEKIEQARGALKFVLRNLREGDTFNIVAYDDSVEAFKPELARFDDKTRAEAEAFADALMAGGSTNIDAALGRALGMLKDNKRPAYVVFLTDGLPTAGVTGEAQIAKNASELNKVRARLFSFGVGFDVNSRLLDKLSSENYGHAEYVRPNEDIEASVAKLYRRIGAPALVDAELKFRVEGSEKPADSVVGRVYPAGPFDLFAGDQAVVIGRYHEAGPVVATLAGRLGEETQTYDFAGEFTAESPDASDAFVARLWAMRRVGDLINQLDLNGRNEELVEELVSLATEHGIVTQYTSFLADENANPNAVASNRARGLQESEDLSVASGEYAFNQRAAKSMFGSRSGASGGGSGIQTFSAIMPSAESAPASPAERYSRVAQQAKQNVMFYDARSGRNRTADNIRQIAGKTFFLRDGKWVDSALDDEAIKNAESIERFGDAYFAFAREQGRAIGPYLAIEEPIVIEIDGRAYSW